MVNVNEVNVQGRFLNRGESVNNYATGCRVPAELFVNPACAHEFIIENPVVHAVGDRVYNQFKKSNGYY